MTPFEPVSLRVFIAICEERSLKAAADRENLTTSAVSKRLAYIEDQIGAALMHRGKGGIALTAAGEAFLPAARGLLQSMTRIQAHMSEYRGGTQGRVRVAASMTAIGSFLPADIAEFMGRHTDIQVSLDERVSPEVLRSVEEGAADLGVYWDAVGTGTLQALPYRADHLVVLVHREHELAARKRLKFSDTLQYERVAIKNGSIVQLTQQRLAIEEGEALQYHVQVRSFDAACRVVAARMAIAIVPKEPSLPLIRHFKLRAIPLTDDWALRRFVICVRNQDELPVPARLLLKHLASKWYGDQAGPV